MTPSPSLTTSCIAFQGSRRIAAGELQAVATQLKPVMDASPHDTPVLMFDQATSARIELDWRGSLGDVLARLPAAEPMAPSATPSSGQPEQAAPRGPGRPRLGVVAKEITLLPRHWEWLSTQRGGASVALRRLVDEARKANEQQDRLREAQESAYRFISVMAGHEAGFEEATRALFAGDAARFSTLTAGWPDDIRVHAQKLAAGAFGLSQAPALTTT
ncbi:MAG: DUF2239 family protein [Rubrivivax sp.]|nr:MAG: DUF2239 family protein [Rubrivivax sp.]